MWCENTHTDSIMMGPALAKAIRQLPHSPDVILSDFTTFAGVSTLPGDLWIDLWCRPESS